jgi:hypothetical protein
LATICRALASPQLPLSWHGDHTGIGAGPGAVLGVTIDTQQPVAAISEETLDALYAMAAAAEFLIEACQALLTRGASRFSLQWQQLWRQAVVGPGKGRRVELAFDDVVGAAL